MIAVKYLLYGENDNLLYSQEIKKYGGDSILCRDEEEIYPILSEITTFDIETFFPEDINYLVEDLNKLKNNLKVESERNYVDEIIELCEKCLNNNQGHIIFNPFVDIVRIASKEKN